METILDSSESLLPKKRIDWADDIVIVLYFIHVLGVGIWASCRSKGETVEGYFLASKTMHWIPVGASLFASNIGSGHFIGLAGSGAHSGISLIVLIMLGWLFVPVYISSKVVTMPEYMRKRFGGQRIRIFLSVQALLLYVFTKISADLYAGALFIKLSLGLEGNSGFYLSVVVLLFIAAIFTVAGGLSAVIWTDFIQTILMIIGSFILMILSFNQVNGYEALMDKYLISEADANYSSYKTDDFGKNVSCGKPREDFMHMFRSVDDPEVPWTGYLGMTISSIWYWCADQVIVQRTISAKNLSHAKAGCIFAGYLKLLPLFLLVFPGMAARVLFTNEVGCSNPDVCEQICQQKSGCSNIAFIKLVLELMPSGLRGLMVAVMLAALMSSLTSIFNSASTIFTIDIWKRFREEPSELELVIVGRFFVVVLVFLSVLWIPIITSFGSPQLFVYIQAISAYLSPQVTAMFLLALFWKRMTESGAFWGLIVGLIVGMARLAAEFLYSVPKCGEPDNRPMFIQMFVRDFHYLHYGTFLFFLTAAVIILVSLNTEKIEESKLNGLLFTTRHKKNLDEDLYDAQANTLSANIPIVLRNVCCLNENNNSRSSVVAENGYPAMPEEDTDPLTESKFQKRFLYIQAAIVVACCSFIMGFYY